MTEDIGWNPTPPASLPWNDINQLYLFNLYPNNDGTLNTSNIANVNVPQWVQTVHQHPGIEAVIAIGGANVNGFSGGACNNTNRAAFVQRFIAFATSNGFDGIDLDIEDVNYFNVGPPNPAMTTCVNALADAGHAAGLTVAADVITNWGGWWWADSASRIDQFNLMSYGDTVAQQEADVQATIDQGLPAAKFVPGVDIIEHPPPAGGCGPFMTSALLSGLAGMFVWAEAGDTYQLANACIDQLRAAYLG